MGKNILILCLAVGLAFARCGLAGPPDNPHEPMRPDSGAVQDPLCRACHGQAPQVGAGGKLAGFSGDGVAECTACHDAADASHLVGVRPDFAVPADLPLDSAGQITCMTCHVTHGLLRSERPWASVSLLDHLFDRTRLHKTFLLRRNNAHGELCLACHTAYGDR